MIIGEKHIKFLGNNKGFTCFPLLKTFTSILILYALQFQLYTTTYILNFKKNETFIYNTPHLLLIGNKRAYQELKTG